LAARLGVADHVSFEGLVPIEELPRVLRGAEIGLVPNRDTNATRLMLPVKLLEYATLGIPVIASRLRTVEHYFPEDAVRMVAPDDPDALAVAIADLYQSPARRRALAEKARRVVNKTRWAHQRGNFFRAVDSLLKSPTPRSSTEPTPPPDVESWTRDNGRDEERMPQPERL